MAVNRPPSPRRRGRDWGKALAVVLCALFALVGAVPLAIGFLVRTSPVRAWAARETSALLLRELGIVARYEVKVQAWPLSIGLEHLVVDASDGGPPFLEVEQITVRPRPFSLLGGQLDAGDVEVIGPRVRVVMAKGVLKNLALRPLPSKPPSGEAPRAPMSSVSITDAHVDARIDGVSIATTDVDLDVSADGDAFEIALRAGPSRVTRVRPVLGREDEEDAVDDDVLCKLEGRVRIEHDAVLVRRLELAASVDFDPEPRTAPSCELQPGDWRRLELQVGALRLAMRDGMPRAGSGRITARLPIGLAHRFVDLPHATGSIGLDVQVEYDDGAKLPRVTGHLSADAPGIDGKLFATHLDGELAIGGEAIRLSHLDVAWADGKVSIQEAKVEPFAKGVALTVGAVDLQGLEFTALLRDLGVHPQAHVAWSLRDGHLPYFKGTLSPVSLEGPITVHSRGFEVFDRPARDPGRMHMMGVKEATIHGSFQVRPTAVVLSGMAVDTPRSHLRTTVSLGFKSFLDFEVFEGSRVDLAEISPLVAIPIGGEVTLKASAHGPFEHPKITGDLSVTAFSFGGMDIGEIERAHAAFEPLALDFTNVQLRHGKSRVRSPKTRIDFAGGADVLVDADVDTRDAPHLALADFFEIFHFDKDPRWEGIAGVASGTGHVHYALGGREDRCGGGRMEVRTEMHLTDVALFGERYDDGFGDVSFVWDDQAAGAAGMEVDVRSATLRKDAGTVVASGSVRHGGVLRMSAIGSGIPIARLDMFGPAARMFDGTAAFVADVGGTVGALETTADIEVSRVRIGPSSLPPSRLRLTIEPAPEPAARAALRTRCGNARAAPFDRAEFDRDLSAGVFRAKGSLFDGQITLEDVRVTQQKHKVMSGKIGISKLDLGTLANLIPGVAFAEAAPHGHLSASIDVKSLPFGDPKKSEATATLSELSVERDGQRISLYAPSGPIALRADDLTIPDLDLELKTRSGLSARFGAGGVVRKVMTRAELDLGFHLDPLDLSRLSADIPQIARASGTIEGSLHASGSPSSPHYTGAMHLKKGELAFKGSPIALDDLFVDVEIGNGEVRLTRGVATVGGGTVSVKARLPIHGLELGTATATITARGLKLPVAEGVDLTADADLEATYRPGAAEAGGEKNLPDVKGTVSLTSFNYTRPITMSVNLSQLTGKSQRTRVETYDPNDDFVRFRVTLVSPRPLRFSNNLVDMQLEVAQPGVVLSGTNQRFGAQGVLRILPDSKLKLRSTEFDVREGMVRFDDPSRISPKVDVRAQTEYRRAAETVAAETGAAAAPTSSGGAAGTSTGGQWRISLHAHGEPENLKIELSSDPPLGQDDIVLLLTMGMTRAEIDRSLASSLGQTVGLEALSQLTGADKAVKTVVPIIDEFRFGTGYSSRTGRTEPTVTLGKRLADGVRANVTTGLTENREVRSTLEWRLNRRMSVQGSYDNVNDVSSSALGNIGADLRWRLEFE